MKYRLFVTFDAREVNYRVWGWTGREGSELAGAVAPVKTISFLVGGGVVVQCLLCLSPLIENLAAIFWLMACLWLHHFLHQTRRLFPHHRREKTIINQIILRLFSW